MPEEIELGPLTLQQIEVKVRDMEQSIDRLTKNLGKWLAMTSGETGPDIAKWLAANDPDKT